MKHLQIFHVLFTRYCGLKPWFGHRLVGLELQGHGLFLKRIQRVLDLYNFMQLTFEVSLKSDGMLDPQR